MLKDSGAALVACQSAFACRVPKDFEIICLEDFKHAFPGDKSPVQGQNSPLDEAYVIYTSGTLLTSVHVFCPEHHSRYHRHAQGCQGVSQERNQWCVAPRFSQRLLTTPAVLCAESGNLGISPGSSCSVWHSTCVSGKRSDACSTAGRSSCGARAGPTGSARWSPCTSLSRRRRSSNATAIRVIATAGEPCPQALADEWSAGKTFYNCCGPTEVRSGDSPVCGEGKAHVWAGTAQTTIVNTMHRHQRPSGHRRQTTACYILDKNLQPLPVGSVGTMWAAGACVTLG